MSHFESHAPVKCKSKQNNKQLHSSVAGAKRHPVNAGSRESEREEKEAVNRNGETRRNKRRLPPRAAPKVMEDGDIHSLSGDIGKKTRNGDSRLGKPERKRQGDGEAAGGDSRGESGASVPIGEINDEEGDRVRQHSPGEEIVDGEGDQHIGEDDESRHSACERRDSPNLGVDMHILRGTAGFPQDKGCSGAL